MRNYSKVLAENLRRRLAELDRRPAWLAKKAGITSSLLSRLLNDGGNPSLSTIASIAEALDLEVDDLLMPNEVPRIKDRWGSVEALEADLKAMFVKHAKIELLLKEDANVSSYEDLMRSRDAIDSEMRHIQGRIEILKKWEAEGASKKKRQPKASPETIQLTSGEIAVADVVERLRNATPAQRAMALTILFEEPEFLKDFELPKELVPSILGSVKSK